MTGTTHLTGQIGGTDLIICSKCGRNHMRLLDCSAPRPATDPLHNVLTMDDAQALMRRNNELLVENERLRAEIAAYRSQNIRDMLTGRRPV